MPYQADQAEGQDAAQLGAALGGRHVEGGQRVHGFLPLIRFWFSKARMSASR